MSGRARAPFFDNFRPQLPEAPDEPPPPTNGAGAVYIGDDWREILMKDEKKKTIRSVVNVLVALRNAPEWHGVFSKDEFANKVMLRREMPNPQMTREFPRFLAETDITNTTAWMHRNGIFVSNAIVLDAVTAAAEETPYHPVREYLTSLRWDNVERLDLWLYDYLGAEDTQLHRTFASKWMIGMVARIFKPGCQFDTALILEGRQGIGKSTALRILTDPWFTDHLSDITAKDSMEELQGKWLIEFAELSTLGRADTARIKSFISAQSDHFRPSYGRITADHPRQCGFAGTVNPGAVGGYLRDETGGRRFWPVLCGFEWGNPNKKLDRTSLASVRDQLWAEATWRFLNHESWYLDAEMEVAQAVAVDDRQEEDPLMQEVMGVIKGREGLTIADILGPTGLGFSRNELLSRGPQVQIGRILTKLGWTKKRVLAGGDRVRRYYPPSFD